MNFEELIALVSNKPFRKDSIIIFYNPTLRTDDSEIYVIYAYNMHFLSQPSSTYQKCILSFYDNFFIQSINLERIKLFINAITPSVLKTVQILKKKDTVMKRGSNTYVMKYGEEIDIKSIY